MKYQSPHKTAVVILSYNSKDWLQLFLPAVWEESQGSYAVYVVDHASTDDTAAFVSTAFPGVSLIILNENHGFAWGYAQALNRIESRYYVLLSADFEITKGWLLPLEARMEADAMLAACQPKVRYYRDREFFEYAGAAGGFMDQWGYMFCRGRIFDTLEKDKGQYDDDIEVFWASGGCLMVRADVYHKVGGLDPDFFAHMEEIDLCWRMKNAGYKIGYVHKSTVFHVGGSVISYGSPKKTFYNFRNSYFLFLKNERSSKLLWLIPLRLMLDGIAGVQFLIKGQWKNCLAIIKAHFSFYVHIPGLLRKRRSLSALILNPNRNGIYHKSILKMYFIDKKTTFNDLLFNTIKI